MTYVQFRILLFELSYKTFLVGQWSAHVVDDCIDHSRQVYGGAFDALTFILLCAYAHARCTHHMLASVRMRSSPLSSSSQSPPPAIAAPSTTFVTTAAVERNLRTCVL
jgi:hypothetical protein